MNEDDIEASSPLVETEDSAPQEQNAPTEETMEAPAEEPTENFQKRIDTVVGQRNQFQQENADLRRQIDAASQVVIPATDTNEPTLEQFDFDQDKFQSALITYRVDQGVSKGLQAHQTRQVEAAQQVQQDATKQAHQARVTAYGSDKSDWNEKVGALVLSPHVQDAIETSEQGAEVLYMLATDPVLAAKVANLQGSQAYMQVGGIAQAILTSGVSNKISLAPDPITPPVGGGGALKTSEVEKMSIDEFMASQGVKKTSY